MSREQVLKYAEEKEKLEKEIEQLVLFLTGPNMPGLKGSLVDSEGFPLPNLDIYQIRQARQRYNILNNDYTSLMQKIETELHSYFGNPETSNKKRLEENIPIKIEIGLNDSPVAFAEVTEISAGSPAFASGLNVNDKIVKFGRINYTNHEALTNLASFVRENEGNAIKVLILREASEVTLTIVPQRWEGPGILGCRFKPLN